MHHSNDEPIAGALRVLIAEANALVRAGLRSIMVADGLAIVGEATSSSAAIASAAALSPDVVLMDASLGDDALVTLRGIRAASPATAVVFFASSVERQHVVAAVEGGASGYLLKDQDGADLLAGVRAAAAGGTPIAPRVVARLIDARVRRDDEQPTARELEVLELVADGFSNKQIARRLGISEGTVKSHLGSAFRRIGATRRTQAALWVHQRRKARPESPATSPAS